MSNDNLLFCVILWNGWAVLTMMFVAGIISSSLPNLIVWGLALASTLGITLVSVLKKKMIEKNDD